MTKIRCTQCGNVRYTDQPSPAKDDGVCGNSWWIMKERLWDGIHIPKMLSENAHKIVQDVPSSPPSERRPRFKLN